MFRSTFCLFIALFSAICIANADETPAQNAPATLWQTQLARETSLQTTLSVEARDQKLPDFLQTLQKESGVKLQLATPSPLAARRVTVRTEAMPLHELMSALARIYGATWQRDGQTYRLQESTLPEIERELLRVGGAETRLDPAQYLSSPQRRALAQQVLEELGERAFAGNSTVSLFELPEALQASIRQRLESHAALSIVEPQVDALPFLIDNYRLYAVVPRAEIGRTTPPQINLNVQNANGTQIASVATIPPEELAPGT